MQQKRTEQGRKGAGRKKSGGIWKKSDGVFYFRTSDQPLKRLKATTLEAAEIEAQPLKEALMVKSEEARIALYKLAYQKQETELDQWKRQQNRVKIAEAWQQHPYTHSSPRRLGVRSPKAVHPLSPVGQRTKRAEWGRFLHWISTLQNPPIWMDEISAEHAQDFSNWLMGLKYTGGYINKVFRTCGVMLVLCGNPATPFDSLLRASARHESRNELTPDQVNKILAKFRERSEKDTKTKVIPINPKRNAHNPVKFRTVEVPMTPAEKAMRIEEWKCANIMVWTLLRVGDACTLKWSNLQGREIHRTLNKTGATVSFPYAKKLQTIIGTKPNGTSEYILPLLANKYEKDPSGVSKQFNKVIGEVVTERLEKRDRNQLGVRRISRYGCHAFRVFGTSIAARRKVSIEALRQWLGHYSEEITRIYVRIKASQQHEVENAIDDALSSASEIIPLRQSRRGPMLIDPDGPPLF